MNSWQFLLGLLAVGLPAGLAAAQRPDDTHPLPLPPSAGPALAAPQEFAPAEMSIPCGGAAPSERSGAIGGVGLYLLQPYFQNNLAYTVFLQQQVTRPPFNPDRPNTQTLAEIADRVSVHSHLAVAPLVWLGYVNDDGFGGRARWWGFREGTSQTLNLPPFAGDVFIGNTTTPPTHPVIAVSGTQATIASAAPLGLMAFGDTVGVQHGAEATSFNVTTELSVQVGDLEVVQGFPAAGGKFLVAGGLRLARIDQTYNAFDAQSGGPAELRSLRSSYNFAGVGPTLALEARRPLGDSGLSLYGMARGSVVFGSAQQNALFFGQELRNDDPNPQFAAEHRSRALPIAELETGVEYGRCVGSSWLFGEVALVGQEWFGAGSASRSANATVATTLRPALGGAALDSNIAFLGLSIRMGLEY